MKKYILSVVIALFSFVANNSVAQEFTVLDTLKYGGKTVEMVSIPLEELHINPKRDNYIKLVTNARKMGLNLCPSDSAFLDRVSKKVWLDSDHKKFQAYVATAPYSEPGGETAFFIPVIVACSDNKQKVELYYERVGFFYPEEFPNPFTPLHPMTELGYWSINTTPRFTPYDWIFLRPVKLDKV